MENNNDTAVFLIILAVSAFLLIVFKLMEFFSHFNREKQYILTEMQRAGDYDEYRYWRRELRCRYLCLIPFVNKRNVMRLYPVIFHRRKYKHEKKENRSDVILHMLAPSVIGVCVCIVCLCGVTRAWFTASSSSGTELIKTPEKYELSVSVYDSESKTISPNNNNEYLLSSGNYIVKLSASGTAGASGYCEVKLVSGELYYTEQIRSPGGFEFTVIVTDENANITLTPKWGSYGTETEENKITQDGKITLSAAS